MSVLHVLGVLGAAVLMILLNLLALSLVLVPVGFLVHFVVFFRAYFEWFDGFLFDEGWLCIVLPLPVLLWLFFVIRPFLKRRRTETRGIYVYRYEEEDFFRLLDALTKILGTPKVHRVRCDNSAKTDSTRSYRGLELTVGLPLVGCLSIGELAALLAFELGHHRRGLSVRLVNWLQACDARFRRVAEQEDIVERFYAWDDDDDDDGEDAFVAMLVAMLTGVIRLVFALFAAISGMATAFLLRRMTYDADHCAAFIAGSERFAGVFAKVAVVREACRTRTTFAGTQAWEAATVAGAIIARAREFGEIDTMRAHRKMIEARASLFSREPSVRSRIKAVNKAAYPGVYHNKRLAARLFHDFPLVCGHATPPGFARRFGDAPSATPRDAASVYPR